MTVTATKTNKGTIFTADGYSAYHRAFVQGAPVFTMFVPAEIVEKANVRTESAIEFCRDVMSDRQAAKACKEPTSWYTRGVRISEFRRIQ